VPVGSLEEEEKAWETGEEMGSKW